MIKKKLKSFCQYKPQIRTKELMCFRLPKPDGKDCEQ